MQLHNLLNGAITCVFPNLTQIHVITHTTCNYVIVLINYYCVVRMFVLVRNLVLFNKELVYRLGNQLFSYIYAVETSGLHLTSYILHGYTAISLDFH